jgi:hypothetical protein
LKVVVVTAITADRDGLKDHQNTEGADFVAFCDRPVASATWEVRPACDLFRDPVRNAKVHKILPHLYFPDHEYSLWIDGSFELVDPAPVLIEKYLTARDLVFGRHGVHRSLGDEMEACFREALDDPALVSEQMASYGAVPAEAGCPLAGAILRRHTKAVARFNALWWTEICRWSRRDQLSLLHSATRAGLRWGYFPRFPELDLDPHHRVLGTPHFRWHPHGCDSVGRHGLEVGSAGDAPAPSWWTRRLEFLEAVSGGREAYALSLEAELAERRRCTEEAESYARSLEAELTKRTRWAEEAERYARSLEEERSRR